MRLLDQVLESGWGAIFLFVYVAGVSHFSSFDLGRIPVMVAAIVPSLVLTFVSISFNDELMEFFAGETIREAFLDIKEKTGEDSEFYWDSDQRTQEQIDEMDAKAHRDMVTILSGIVIAGSLPVAVYWLAGLTAAIGGVALAVVVAYLLCVRPYRHLGEVIKSSVKLYDTSDED